MNKWQSQRRSLLKLGLCVPALSAFSPGLLDAATNNTKRIDVPETIRQQLLQLYGDRGNHIIQAEQLSLQTPYEIYGNELLSIKAVGHRDNIRSLAILIERQERPLVAFVRFNDDGDLPFSTRIKFPKTSNVYLVAETDTQIVGDIRTVRVVNGSCGG